MIRLLVGSALLVTLLIGCGPSPSTEADPMQDRLSELNNPDYVWFVTFRLPNKTSDPNELSFRGEYVLKLDLPILSDKALIGADRTNKKTKELKHFTADQLRKMLK